MYSLLFLDFIKHCMSWKHLFQKIALVIYLIVKFNFLLNEYLLKNVLFEFLFHLFKYFYNY